MESKEQQLFELMFQLEAVMRREMIQRHRSSHSSFNPHRGQGRIMLLLKIQPEITQKELSYLLDMSKQALAELLGKLEAVGYITRTPSEEDKRVMLIRLTEAGRKAADTMEQQQQSESNSVFSCLTVEEQDTLLDYLKRLITEGEKNMPEGLRRHRRHARGAFLQNGNWDM